MAIVSCGALIDVLRQLRLLDEPSLAALFAAGGGRCADVRSVAKSLIQRGLFTVYQMNQLLAGHGKELILGPYIILDRLGKGGQSDVYKARHSEHEWVVALKVIRAAALSTSAATQQFLQEMTAMAELDHPNIVQFLDVDKADDTYYCAMEFVEGTDLAKVVQLQGPVASAVAADYTRQVALGLQHAHEHSIVHRDIKPMNLYLTAKPNSSGSPAVGDGAALVKILDWGLAGFRLSAAKKPQSADGTSHKLIGTADYMSPEQAVDAGAVDIRADIYSLGCSLYFLLTGQTPFSGNTVLQKVMQHQVETARPVEEMQPELPAGLAAVVKRMMAKKPEERYQTPVAVALALAPFCRASAVADSQRTWSLSTHQLLDRRRPLDETPSISGTLLGETMSQVPRSQLGRK
jgi:serine/threonine-protein kinase